MSLVSFLKDAGERLFGAKDANAKPATAPASSGPTVAENVGNLNDIAARSIEKYIATQGLSASGLKVSFDGASATVTVSGEAPDQATREKIVLCCGNVQGVAQVRD